MTETEIEELKQRYAEAMALFKGSRILSASLSFEEVQENILDVLESLYEASLSFIMLYDNNRDVLEITAYRCKKQPTPSAYGEKGKSLKKIIIQKNEYIGERCFRRKQPLIANDIHKDERIKFKDELLAMGVRSILCVPLVVKGNAIGVMCLCLPHRENANKLEYTSQLLTIFAGQAAIAIENTRLYEELERANEQICEWNERLQKKVEETTEKLVASRERLWHAERLSTVGKLVAGLIHEINNPLYAISNYAQRLIELESEETKLKYLEAIEQGVSMMEGVTENLLELTRLSSLSKEVTDINELLKDTIALVEFDAQEQGVLIKREFDNSLPPIESDAAKLRQVFLNLLINALDAMPEGGTITVKTQGFLDHVSIMISDTGVGIGEEDLPHIFEPYFSTKEDEGIGLGLFVSASIIQAHDGKITVESEKDVGTCFKITLPVES